MTEWTGVDVKTRTENIEHVYDELTAKIDAQLKQLAVLLDKDLKALNELIHQHKVPAIVAGE